MFIISGMLLKHDYYSFYENRYNGRIFNRRFETQQVKYIHIRVRERERERIANPILAYWVCSGFAPTTLPYGCYGGRSYVLLSGYTRFPSGPPPDKRWMRLPPVFFFFFLFLRTFPNTSVKYNEDLTVFYSTHPRGHVV